MADSHSILIRAAVPSDVSALFELILALADYEQLADQVTGSAEALGQHLFGSARCIQAIVADCAGQAVGFALFFVNYSTSITQPGLYLEDLFVLPDYRGGVGKALLSRLAQIALEQGCGRLEWSVLDWNTPAIGFYKRIGAQVIENARTCRVAGTALTRLAALSQPDLRPATAADLPDIFRLVKANIQHDGGLERFTGTEAVMAQHLFEQAYAEVVLAERDGQTVGLALYNLTYSTFLTQPGLFVEDLFVQPQYRSQGIGTALLGYLAQQVVARGYGRLEWGVRVWNQQALAFYQRLGATVLPDWRFCQMVEPEITALANLQTSLT
ncbi:MAG: GNAT family N-acetyltransferase [Pegethrix bostrychoides GSE-TBD4-15B]|uniref:GNAT family N-acetyltransferase n=1 Tax=Pegethrix bostrychoides GSE-TBD4-15B TaxID=2839662 RepID=A0A951U6S6_9CYAN|nr:GNAT family N-acetyltransferase [Pegethrix bostrychoides GSE-TBD4-15B]